MTPFRRMKCDHHDHHHVEGTNAGITMAKAMNAVTITAMKAAAIITVKTTSADTITEKASTAAMRRVTRSAAVITVSKPLCEDHIRTELSRIMGRTGSMVPSFTVFSNTLPEARKRALT